MAAHYSLIHRKDQTAWLSTRRICPITTLPFLTLISRLDMKFALSTPVWMTVEIIGILLCDLWMNIVGGTFTMHYLFFTMKFGNVVDFGHCWNEPSNKFKYFKSGNSGLRKHFELFDLKRTASCICCGLILYIYIYIIIYKLFQIQGHAIISYITIPRKTKEK